MITLNFNQIAGQHLKYVRYVVRARNQIVALSAVLDDMKGLANNYNGIEEQQIAQFKVSLSDTIRDFGTMLDNFIRELIILADIQVTSATQYAEVFEWMHENGHAFKSRGLNEAIVNFTRAGVGQLYTCLKDKYGYDIEAMDSGKLTFEITQTLNLGRTAGREAVKVTPEHGGLDYVDFLANDNTLQEGPISVVAPIDTSILGDPSFASIADPGVGVVLPLTATSELGTWSLDSGVIGSLSARGDKYHRLDGTDSAYGLSLSVAGVAAVGISTPVRQNFSRNVPLNWGIHLWAVNFTGTVQIQLGTRIETTTYVAGTSTEWDILRVSNDLYSWFDNFEPTTSGNVTFSIVVTPTAGNLGYVVMDDCFCLPYFNYDNKLRYLMILAGELNFILGEEASQTISYTNLPDAFLPANQANRQYAEAVIYRRYFPHDAAVFIADDIT